jgi:glycosyltransferase involved in cell wall biosynthesis
MKGQLVVEFAMPADRVTVIPFGINDTISKTGMTRAAARQQLGIGNGERTLLFFGQIAPYKGIEYLIQALARLARDGERVRLIIREGQTRQRGVLEQCPADDRRPRHQRTGLAVHPVYSR